MNIDDNKTKPLKSFLVEGRVRVSVSVKVIAETESKAELIAQDLFYKHAGHLENHKHPVDFICVEGEIIIDNVEGE